MTEIIIDGNVFEVDEERTRDYYGIITLCECELCRTYYGRVQGLYPKTEELLSRFSLDIAKPDELFPTELENETQYGAAFTVCGRIVSLASPDIELREKQGTVPINFIKKEEVLFPHKQEKDFFGIEIFNINIELSDNN